MNNEREIPEAIRSQVIERQRLGRGWVHWMEEEKFAQAARQLRSMGWSDLEAVTAFEVVHERAIVLTYFLSGASGVPLWIRYSIQRDPNRTSATVRSVEEVWPAAGPMEAALERGRTVRFRKTGH